MIFGDYPCCNAPLAIAVPDKTPVYFRELCPTCGVPVWHRLSRLDPESWTEVEFLKEFRVDEATKSIHPLREEAEEVPLTAKQMELLKAIMLRTLLYGDSSSTEIPVGILGRSPIKAVMRKISGDLKLEFSSKWYGEFKVKR